MSPNAQLAPEIPEPHYQEAEAAFEESLGSDFGTASIIEEESAGQPQPEVVFQRADSMFVTMQRISIRDHKVAGMLAVVLGVFGMHKFYMGYHEQGFILLFATIIIGVVSLGLGVLAIWMVALVEGLIYFSFSQQRFEDIYIDGTHAWF